MSERHGGWVLDDPIGIRTRCHYRLIPGDPDFRVFLHPIVPMLKVWLDLEFNAFGWRLDTARLRQLLRHDPESVAGWLHEFCRVSKKVGYRSERVERALVRAIVEVRGPEGLVEVLSDSDEELRTFGIRMLKHLEGGREVVPNAEG